MVSWDQGMNISDGGEYPYGFLTWSPCGRLVAANSQGVVEIRDASSSELISTLKSTQTTFQLRDPLAYSPDGRSLATLSNTLLIIWDIQTGGVAKEVHCGNIHNALLTWSLDGQMIGIALQGGVANFNYTVYVYDIGLDMVQSPGTVQSIGIPHLWAHDRSFRIMTTGWDGQSWTINISESGSVLTKIESFHIRELGRDMRIGSFSPTTYQISISVHNQACVVDIRNSTRLLQQEGDYTPSHCFSADGSLFTNSMPTHIYIWKYNCGHYTMWRHFPTLGMDVSLLQVSPTLSGIVGSFQGGLQVWHLDRPPVDPHPGGDRPLAILSHHGIYIATAHLWDSTVTITNPLSQSPPWTIDTDMSVEIMALTGNVLLVQSRETITAWQLTDEGAVKGVSGHERVDIGNSIWTLPLPDFGPTFLIQDQTVVMKWGFHGIHIYHMGTGEVLKPAQVPLNLHGCRYSLSGMSHGLHYPHYHGLETYNSLSKNDWLISQTALQQGWVKDPEGRCRMWIPAECRIHFQNAGWFHNITTLKLNAKGGTMIIMF